MLVLKRKEGQWLDFKMAAEKYPDLTDLLMRLRVQNIRFNPRTGKGEVDLVIDDNTRHFDVQRPERAKKQDK